MKAEFATSAVDFLHRVGRTARAGHSGIVTSLYTKSNRDLVSAVQRAERTGEPVVSLDSNFISSWQKSVHNYREVLVLILVEIIFMKSIKLDVDSNDYSSFLFEFVLHLVSCLTNFSMTPGESI